MIAGGGALIGQFFGSALLGGAIGGIVAGIPAFGIGIYDAIVNGLDWLSSALIGAGATAAGAGIGAIIGMCGGPIGAGIGALIGLAVGLITDLVILVVQNWDAICSWCSTALAAVGQFFVNLWQGVVDVWMSVLIGLMIKSSNLLQVSSPACGREFLRRHRLVGTLS